MVTEQLAPANPLRDEYTRDHLRAWIARNVPENDVGAYNRISALLDNEPKYLLRGWEVAYDRSRDMTGPKDSDFTLPEGNA